MEKETILITGANSSIGKFLKQSLCKDYHIRFLGRTPQEKDTFFWNVEKNQIDERALDNVSHIINLCGASIYEKRWTKQRKETIMESRVKATELIIKEIQKKNIKLKSFISASAVGYYGTITTDQIFDENSPKGDDFLSSVCENWEKEALKAEKISEKTIIMRLGVVMHPCFGAYPEMIKPIKYHLGAILGSGKQLMPWVSLEDVVSFVNFSLKNDIQGVFNLVSIEKINHQQVMRLLAEKYQKKLLPMNIPAWLIKLIFGQGSVLILEGSHISNEKLKKQGFVFKHESFSSFLQSF